MGHKGLVPLKGSRLPPRIFLCFEGVASACQSQPIALGSTVSKEYLERPLKEYLEDTARELESLGKETGPLLVQGGVTEKLLESAQDADAGIFLISIHGPYRIQDLDSAEGATHLAEKN